MNKTEQAQQLRLAAELIETGHPFAFQDGGEWVRAITITPDHAICERREIRPILATPPDGRPLHNPDGLSAEQVGLGYRLGLQEESANQPHEVWMINNGWQKALVGEGAFNNFDGTYRLPLSVPWPEAKPEAPPFQLPPPPPGMRWHREDRWKEGDLPQGYRPLVDGEYQQSGDSAKYNGRWDDFPVKICYPMFADACHRRTTRPLVFTHEGKEWTYHRPGDPMPCDGERQVCLYRLGAEEDCDVSNKGKNWFWKDETIIGWRYTETTKQVELGPEDVRCGDEILVGDDALIVTAVRRDGIGVFSIGQMSYDYLQRFKIRRRDSVEWEPCSKEVQA